MLFRLSRPRAHALSVASLSVLLVLPACSASSQLASSKASPVDSFSAERTVASTTPDRIVLTPTARTGTSQFVTWRTATSQKRGVVQISRAKTGETAAREVVAQQVTDPKNSGPGAHHFTARVDQLRPGTTYAYRVGAPGAWSGWRSFTTARTTQPDAWSFLYFGDAQIGLSTTWKDVVERAHRRAPGARLSLHTGDLVDAPTEISQWASWFASMAPLKRTTETLPAPGNHETHNDPALEQFRAHYALPRNGAEGRRERTYFTDYQGVRFIAMYGTDDQPQTAQREWLQKTLASNKQKFTVVYFHQPIFSASLGRDNKELRDAWRPLLEKYNVDLVLQGHDHVYARGAMKNRRVRTGVFSGPMYVVSSAGAKYYDLDRGRENNWTRNGAVRLVAYEKVSTFQKIIVKRDRLIYRSIIGAKPRDSKVSGKLGSVLDSFTVVRRKDGTKRVFNGVRP